MKDAQFSYYASAIYDSYAEPIDKSDGGIFSVSKGRVFVCVTFDIKNNDRSTLDVGSWSSDWKLDFSLIYKGQEYPLKNFDLNNKNGSTLELSNAGISSDGGNTWTFNGSGGFGSSNILLHEGQKITLRVPALAIVDPDSLNDSFELTVNIPDSSGQYEYYTYEVK